MRKGFRIYFKGIFYAGVLGIILYLVAETIYLRHLNSLLSEHPYCSRCKELKLD